MRDEKPDVEVLTEGDVVKEEVRDLKRKVNEVIEELDTFDRKYRRSRRKRKNTKKVRSTT